MLAGQEVLKALRLKPPMHTRAPQKPTLGTGGGVEQRKYEGAGWGERNKTYSSQGGKCVEGARDSKHPDGGNEQVE